LALVLSVLAIGIYGIALSSVYVVNTIPSAGTVKGIGVGIYWNSECTNRTSSIYWGLLEPGSNKTLTVYIRNEGNSRVTLSKVTQNWSPLTASDYITLDWDYAGQALSVNQVLQTKLTLVVSSSISGITSFSFDTIIAATG